MEDDSQELPKSHPSGVVDAPKRDAISELFLELCQWMGRGGRDRLGQGARASRRAMDKYQAKRDVDRLYQKLGRETSRLIQAGEISHPGLAARLPRIRDEEERLFLIAQTNENEE